MLYNNEFIISLSIVILFYICYNHFNQKIHNIYISNEYVDTWFMMNKRKYNCGKIKCIVSNSKKYNYNAKIFSRFYYKRNVEKNNKSIYIICNLEALSRWKIMNNTINGSDKKFDVLISYKHLLTKHHFPYNYYYNNIDLIIKDAKKSIISLNKFMKRKEMVFIYGRNYNNRNKLCEIFNEKIKVDKYGSAFEQHLKWPNNIPNEKHILISNYKFCLAFENTINQVQWGQMHSDPIDDDYITEKLWDCLRGGSIPIYFGAKNARMFFPTNKSIIYTNDFKSYKQLVEYVVLIKNNSTILNEYINWPYTYSKSWYKKMKFYSFTPCKLCKFIFNYNKEYE